MEPESPKLCPINKKCQIHSFTHTDVYLCMSSDLRSVFHGHFWSTRSRCTVIPNKAMCYNIIITQHLFIIWTCPCHVFPPCAAFSSLVCTVREAFMVFGCCQFHWREACRAPMGLRIQDHTFGSFRILTQLLSRRNDLIPGVVKWSAHTYTHTRMNMKHMKTHKMLVFSFSVSLSATQTQLNIDFWWNYGAFTCCCCRSRWFTQRLPHRTLQRGLPRYLLLLWSTKQRSFRFISVSPCHPQDVQAPTTMNKKSGIIGFF